MRKTERGLYKKRRSLIAPLTGRILEVGSGTGTNFQFYSKHAEIMALEPNTYMRNQALKKADDTLTVKHLNYGICDEDLESHIEKESLDAIVSTLVLCSVKKPGIAIERFKQWLKPEGKLIILEHIHASNPINKQFQNLLNPIWRTVSDGCNLNRNTDEMLMAAGFTSNNTEYFVQSLRWVMGVYTIDHNL